jgi:Co/Zn/Cd efflux system component
MSFFIEVYRVSNRQNQLPYSFLLFSQVYFPLFATLVLVAFMVDAIIESIPVLINPNSKPPVDIMYVFLFGSLNLIIDICVAFFYLHDFIGVPCFQKVVLEDKTGRSGFSTPMTPLVGEKPNKIEVEDRNYIIVSAIIHLVADALNAVLELGAVCFVYYGHYNANFSDALVAIISAVIVIAVCIWFLFDIASAYRLLEKSKGELLGVQKEKAYTYI